VLLRESTESDRKRKEPGRSSTCRTSLWSDRAAALPCTWTPPRGGAAPVRRGGSPVGVHQIGSNVGSKWRAVFGGLGVALEWLGRNTHPPRFPMK
jgi:hypothetical protein